ncbi:MAG: hypothetical protein H6Q38_2625 [Chloroflexi bacterium]|nr:hypothetical protein [Chloroflexota bacterium]
MDIQLLYFDGCPSWQSALTNLKLACAEENLDVSIQLVRLQDVEEAMSRRFLGSPSIHVNNIDLWPEEQDEYFWGCRIYPTPVGLSGWPTVEMIRERIRDLVSSNPGAKS